MYLHSTLHLYPTLHSPQVLTSSLQSLHPGSSTVHARSFEKLWCEGWESPRYIAISRCEGWESPCVETGDKEDGLL